MGQLPIGQRAKLLRGLAVLLLCGVLAGDFEWPQQEPCIAFLGDNSATQDTNFQRFEAEWLRRQPELSARIRVKFVALAASPATHGTAFEQVRAANPVALVAVNAQKGRLARRHLPQVPLVFSTQADPVEFGLVSQIGTRQEPSTGIWFNDDLDAKRLELLLDAFPELKRVAVLGTAEWADALPRRGAHLVELGRSRGVQVEIVQTETLASALDLVGLPRWAHVQAWCLPRTRLSLQGTVAQRIALLSKPVMAAHTPDVYAGAHLSYSHDRSFVIPALVDLTARIARGEPAGAIPIQMPHRFQLVVRIAADPRLPRLNPDFVRRADLVVR